MTTAEEGIFCLPWYARRKQPDTQILLAADLQALFAFDGACPAPSHQLMRGQPDAPIQGKALARDRGVGHHGVSGYPPLHRPG